MSDNSEKLIYDLIDGQLSAEEIQRAEKLIEEDADLARLYSELRAQQQTLREMPKYRLPESFADQVLAEANAKGLFESQKLVAGSSSPAPATSSTPAADTSPAPKPAQQNWRGVVATIAALAALLLVGLFAFPAVTGHKTAEVVAKNDPSMSELESDDDSKDATGQIVQAKRVDAEVQDERDETRKRDLAQKSFGDLADSSIYTDEAPAATDSMSVARAAGAKAGAKAGAGFGGGFSPDPRLGKSFQNNVPESAALPVAPRPSEFLIKADSGTAIAGAAPSIMMLELSSDQTKSFEEKLQKNGTGLRLVNKNVGNKQNQGSTYTVEATPQNMQLALADLSSEFDLYTLNSRSNQQQAVLPESSQRAAGSRLGPLGMQIDPLPSRLERQRRSDKPMEMMGEAESAPSMPDREDGEMLNGSLRAAQNDGARLNGLADRLEDDAEEAAIEFSEEIERLNQFFGLENAEVQTYTFILRFVAPENIAPAAEAGEPRKK